MAKKYTTKEWKTHAEKVLEDVSARTDVVYEKVVGKMKEEAGPAGELVGFLETMDAQLYKSKGLGDYGYDGKYKYIIQIKKQPDMENFDTKKIKVSDVSVGNDGSLAIMAARNQRTSDFLGSLAEKYESVDGKGAYSTHDMIWFNVSEGYQKLFDDAIKLQKEIEGLSGAIRAQ